MIKIIETFNLTIGIKTKRKPINLRGILMMRMNRKLMIGKIIISIK